MKELNKRDMREVNGGVTDPLLSIIDGIVTIVFKIDDRVRGWGKTLGCLIWGEENEGSCPANNGN